MDVEAELKNIFSQDELEAEVSSKVKSFHGLLTREVALRLIAKERGILKADEEREYRLGGIPKNAKKVAFQAKVVRVWPVATYASGKRSRVIEVQDDTVMPLILWNDDIELARNLRLNDEIEVRGAYESGGELHLGYSGVMEITKRSAITKLDSLIPDQRAHVRGFVARLSGPCLKDIAGKPHRGFCFTISDGAGMKECFVWEGAERASHLKEGDELILEAAFVGKDALLLDSQTRMHSRRASQMLIGKVSGIEADGDTLRAVIGERKIELERQDALRLMGADIAADIGLSTLVSLKKDALVNSSVALRIEERDGKIHIRG